MHAASTAQCFEITKKGLIWSFMPRILGNGCKISEQWSVEIYTLKYPWSPHPDIKVQNTKRLLSLQFSPSYFFCCLRLSEETDKILYELSKKWRLVLLHFTRRHCYRYFTSILAFWKAKNYTRHFSSGLWNRVNFFARILGNKSRKVGGPKGMFSLGEFCTLRMWVLIEKVIPFFLLTTVFRRA